MTDICYDTEFIEDGQTIDLISIGMVREDGAEYYAVNSGMPLMRIWKNEWLRANVLPSLPVRDLVSLDMTRPEVKPRQVIANEAREFITAAPDPQLWADWAAYDHVVLCQLWGTMVNLPEGIPMWTHDLRQELERLGNPELPPMPGANEHNALSDAREVAFRLRWLRDHERR